MPELIGIFRACKGDNTYPAFSAVHDKYFRITYRNTVNVLIFVLIKTDHSVSRYKRKIRFLSCTVKAHDLPYTVIARTEYHIKPEPVFRLVHNKAPFSSDF